MNEFEKQVTECNGKWRRQEELTEVLFAEIKGLRADVQALRDEVVELKVKQASILGIVSLVSAGIAALIAVAIARVFGN